MSQLKKGAMLSYLSMMIINVVGIVITPFVVRHLGKSEYGLYSLIGAFVGYMSVLDFGLNDAVVRFTAKYRSEKDQNGEHRFLSTIMIIYMFIALFVLVLGFVIYPQLDIIFGNSLTSDEIAKAQIMFVILIFNIAFSIPGRAFTSICNGYQEFVFPRALNIVRYLTRSLLVLAILFYGGDAVSLVILDTVMNLGVIMVTMIYVFRKLKVILRLDQFDRNLVKLVFSYSVWIFILTLVLQFQWQAGQVLLALKTNTSTIAVYAIGIMLGGYYYGYASAINEVFLPRAMNMVTMNATGKVITDTAIRVGRIVFIVLSVVLGGFIVFGEEFIVLWVGDSYRDSWLMALLIMITSINVAVQFFFNAILKAKNLSKFKGVSYLILIFLGSIVGYFLIDVLGSVGIVTGICATSLISQLLMNAYFKHKLQIELVRFYRELTRNTLFIFISITTIGFWVNQYFPQGNWFVFFLKVFIFFILFAICLFYLGFNAYEKNNFRYIIRRFSKLYVYRSSQVN